tara:strand:+ start:1019 stop:1849 length:831 start_codon:yes stop_codon:yes gene_type:complete
MVKKKIIICSTIKNEEKNLGRFFKKINSLLSIFEEHYLIFVLSDTYDKSENLLNDYLKGKRGTVIVKNFDNQTNRIEKLEICRNEYLNFIRKNNEIKDYDYLLVMDADGVNNILNEKVLAETIQKEKWNAIFANQKFFYYDIFALRIDKLINENFILKIKKDFQNNVYEQPKRIIFNNLTRFFFINKLFKERYIEVNSAFGGLGIYKLNIILEFNYHSNSGKNCEHVKLNEDINKKYGGMFIDKLLFNSYGLNIHSINGLISAVSNIFAKRFINKI